MALHCWDGVPKRERDAYPGIVEHQLRIEERKVQSVDYVASPEVNHSMSITNGDVVTVYSPNLKPSKWIRVQFEPGHSRHALELEVGEKKGKLMIIHRIPQQP